MKRLAICLFVCTATIGWVAGGPAWARKGGGGGKAPAPAPAAGDAAPAATDNSQAAAPAAGGDQAAAPADNGQAAGGEAAPGGDTLEPDDKTGLSPEEMEGKAKPATTLSWQDIVVVPRKAFLKGGRLEVAPFVGTSINDNLVRHYGFGLEVNLYLTDVFWIGLEGQYYVKALSEREDLIGLQYNRIPTLNHYLYSGAFNFGYVPVYGKFSWFNRSIMHWEIWASAGFGVTESETIPRNPGTTPFKNTILTPNVGIGSRFFMFDWLTVNFSLRDYIIPDRFEPLDNTTANFPTPADAKAAGTQQLVQNVMFSVGVGVYLPTKFQYKTPR